MDLRARNVQQTPSAAGIEIAGRMAETASNREGRTGWRLRTLGDGLRVSALGLGCMPMVGTGAVHYGAASEAESLATIQRAIDLGITFFDTAEIYGPHVNEELLGRAIRGRRDGLVIATKFGFRISPTSIAIDSSPENVRRACDGCLARLGIETIDLFYQHRVDPNVPIEDTVGAVADLVRAGKVRHIGLSEASAATLAARRGRPPDRGAAVGVLAVGARRRGRDPADGARARHRLRAVQPARPRLPDRPDRAPRRPPGGRLPPPRSALRGGELRRRTSRSSDVLRAIGAARGASAAQVALAWLLAQGDDVVPDPGLEAPRDARGQRQAGRPRARPPRSSRSSTRRRRAGATAGPRYGEFYMRMVDP